MSASAKTTLHTMLGNYPENLSLTVDGPNTFVQAATLAQGIQAIVIPNISKGSIPLPPGFSANTLESHIRRDYSESWNLTLQKQFAGGLMAHTLRPIPRQPPSIALWVANN